MKRRIGTLLAVLWLVPAGQAPAREVVLVANAEGGTVSLVDARSFRVLREIDVIPDGESTAFEDNPMQALAGQQIVEAAGGKNYAQDQDVSPDGRTLYVSRGHKGDVAGFDLATGRLLWKVAIPGLRSDHMTISDDGSRLYVSALTDGNVYAIDTATRTIAGSFASGEWPHDNHLSHDGTRLYNGSIGNIVAPEEGRGGGEPPYRLTIVDPGTLEPLGSHTFERGIRPYVITDDETRMYAQLSEFHGVIEFDLEGGRIARTRELPIDEGVTEEDYDFEAPHHGLAMTPDERTLCAAGRASDYVALLATDTLEPRAIIEVGDAPGWAAIGLDGRHCFVANTRADTLSVISIAKRREVARLKPGDGPKELEVARLPQAVVCTTRATPGCRPRLRLTSRCVGGGRVRVRLRGEIDAVRSVRFRPGGRDAAPPFTRTFGPERQGRRLVATAAVTRGPTPRVTRTTRLPRCP